MHEDYTVLSLKHLSGDSFRSWLYVCCQPQLLSIAIPAKYKVTESTIYSYPCKYKFTRDETWVQDPATWSSLHDARLSRGSMLYNQRERLLTQQA